ncbi:MAG TPA: hypothetical protein VIO14_01985 [Dehalococcoidia bacterium]
MRVTIAGYGSIGRYVEETFRGRHEIAVYDPPLGLGSPADLRETDFVILCVPTPSLPTGECDVRIVEELVAAASPRRAIVCHSTVAIGTTDRLLEAYGKPLVFVPEYAGESPDHPYRRPEARDFFIFGGYEPAVSQVRALFESVYGARPRYFAVPPRVAECVKYMENAFLALKVAFCNEFYDLCRAVGVEYETVRELWLQDGRINPSHTVVTPERGYGGKCLPKDVAAVCATGRAVGAPMEILEAVQRANRRHRSVALAAPVEGGAP